MRGIGFAREFERCAARYAVALHAHFAPLVRSPPSVTGASFVVKAQPLLGTAA
jgi:hypothetical protein